MSGTVMIALACAYLAFLVALFASPLLVHRHWGRVLPWRRALMLAVGITVAELVLAFFVLKAPLVFVIAEVAKAIPWPPHAVGIRDDVMGTVVFELLLLPYKVALTGGGLAIAWLTVVSIWRATRA